MPLIVVLREDAVVSSGQSLVEHGVGRDRPGDLEGAGGIDLLNGRAEDFDLLVTECTILAAVRIERCDGQPRRRNSVELEGTMGSFDGIDLGVDGERIEGLAQGHVAGGEEDLEFVVGDFRVLDDEHRVLLRHSGQLTEHLGVPEVLRTGLPHGFLVDGAGDDTGDLLSHGRLSGDLDRSHRGLAGASIDDAPFRQIVAEDADAEDVDDAFACRGRRPVGDGAQLDIESEDVDGTFHHGQIRHGDPVLVVPAREFREHSGGDLRSDADGIAHGHGECWCCHCCLLRWFG